MPLSERKKAHQDDVPRSVHNLTEVSKNAFVEPFSAPQNYVTNHPREFTQQPNLVLHFCSAWVYRQSERPSFWAVVPLVGKVWFDRLSDCAPQWQTRKKPPSAYKGTVGGF